ncbi:LacI family transcriptional regulator [Sphaerisporangium album]|uniref:LacI family transcriptional regulator n=1 Tax=Sphaerisporangium album TaxID=509200 RepID=A0A367FS66_9ACTN|nr:LacI family DNA-binding transcriptional regulator [Sphaerisporangium album]RCG33266.1 LacI family transcriptional regulator [Sphaerisporangium album]
MHGNARLSDIAAQAGVSEATVSRVLNGKSGVSAATRQLVLTALDLMGYERPQRLRQRSNGLIGLVTPELDNPIFPAFAQAIERSLTQHGYTPVLCTQSPGGAPEDEFTELLLERDVSGIIFVSGLHADTTARMDRYTRLTDRGLPIVLVDGYSEHIEAPFISPDDRLAARLAVQHLADLGHERIGLALGQRRFVPVIRKIEGFTQAMSQLLGVSDCEPLIQHSLFSVEGGQAAAGALLGRGCTGIVCASDLMALGAIRAARERGLSVPGDVSVVGFDDSPLIAFTDPPLTTVRKPIGAMATAAVQTLLEEINGAAPKNTELIFQPELVVRGSTGSGPRINR